MRLNQSQLTFRALQVLEEVSRNCKDGPVPRAQWLRFCLGYLHSLNGGDRAPFDSFWLTVTDLREGFSRQSDGIGRSQNAHASLNGIYRAVGVERTTEMMFHYTKATPKAPIAP